MNSIRSNPNRASRFRTTAAILAAGGIGLLGCTDTDPGTSPTTTSGPDKTEQAFTVDNNCKVAGSVSISSNTEKTVEEFVDGYLDYLGEQTGEDLSDCDDEMYAEIGQSRANIESGAVSPTSETHSVVMPRVVEPND